MVLVFEMERCVIDVSECLYRTHGSHVNRSRDWIRDRIHKNPIKLVLWSLGGGGGGGGNYQYNTTNENLKMDIYTIILFLQIRINL